MATTADNVLWKLIESRDRAFAMAHEAFRSLTREAREKDAEITRLKAAANEKDQEIVRLKAAAIEKDQEIQMLTRAAADRLAVIQQLQASREYKAGVIVLHPWRVLRRRL